ncbi:uncharacterized protein BDZ99DRAFT_462867 [Mytilinidion resinicola]|uniref:Uncharacterized protein n=1 Tax=Mytilinidion resinicola TaxID=574789 RepID=A0A6A6YNZ6_9PEZI|nr:uncharacterized protein BDZ99DRAFT_462867 [Mytilinidion resinicola]KAF2810279.1 hypothetical protein BDZ99DRAFT_462867 [Mytilinidion resinicola]
MPMSRSTGRKVRKRGNQALRFHIQPELDHRNRIDYSRTSYPSKSQSTRRRVAPAHVTVKPSAQGSGG